MFCYLMKYSITTQHYAALVLVGVAVGGRAETLHRLRNRNRCSTATIALRRPIACNVVLPTNCILCNQQNSRTYTNQPKTTLRQTEFWRTAILFRTSANYNKKRYYFTSLMFCYLMKYSITTQHYASFVLVGVAVGGRAETLHRLRNRNRCSTATTALRRPIAYNVVLPDNCILRNQQNSRIYTNQPKTSERRRIGMSAVYHSFARRGGSDQHVFR